MEPSGLESNTSHQELMSDSDSGVDLAVASNSKGNQNKFGLNEISFRDWCTICILCFVNLINYMDRFTIAGILPSIKDYFNVLNNETGLIQTVFVFSYMIFAPLFGYLGDRYNRRYIMAAGVILWSLTTLIGSFMQNFTWFMIFRAFVGIGEASYSTIAPTIISDMFVDSVRSKMLALFYFAIPVGSGLGYIVGAETARIANQWQYALRVTPVLGMFAVILILLVLKEPERGGAEGGHSLHTTTWGEDLKALFKNRSFVFSSLGFTCVAFVAGALAWWGPTYVYMGIKLNPNSQNTTMNDVSFKFGLVSMFAGICGVLCGSFTSQYMRRFYNDSDPLICGFSLLTSAPLVFLALVSSSYQGACFLFIFLAQIFLNFTWAIVADILLYVVIPTRRSSAEALQILVSHAFGDAGSPFLVGLISDAIKSTSTNGIVDPDDLSHLSYAEQLDEFKSLQYALFITAFVEILGGIFFLITAAYIVRDKVEAERATNSAIVPGIQQPRHLYADDIGDSEQRRNLVA